MVLQHDFILGQGAGFIGAEDVHRAKILNGVEVLHDNLLLRQLHRPARQRRGDDHRQHLRRQANRHRQREQRRLPPVAFGVAIDQQHHRGHHQHKADQQHAHPTDAFLEGVRLALLLADAAGQLPKPGVAAGGEDDGLRRAAHHVGAHKAQGVALQRVLLQRIAAAGHFLHRQRFAGQRGLGDEQIPRLQDTQVGRDHVSRRQPDDVARHQLVDRQFQPAALPLLVDHPQHGGGIAHHRLQRIRRFGRARLLDEVEQRRDPHHQGDNPGGEQILGGIGDDAEHRQQQIERVAVASPQMHPPRRGLLRRDLVVTVFEDFRRHFAFIEPFWVAVKGAPDLLVVHRRHVQTLFAQRLRNGAARQMTGVRQRIALD